MAGLSDKDPIKIQEMIQKQIEEQRVEIERLTAMAIGHEATSEYLRVTKSQLATQTERVRVLTEALEYFLYANWVESYVGNMVYAHTFHIDPSRMKELRQALTQDSLGDGK